MNETKPIECTPELVAAVLRASGLPEDDVLDMLRRIGEKLGWTKELNRVGLLYLKPDAPAGQEREA